MEGRAKAAAAREDKIAAAAAAAEDATAAAEWVPKRDPALGPRRAARVGKLSAMCLALLVEHIDAVETLWGLPSIIKVGMHGYTSFSIISCPCCLLTCQEDLPPVQPA